jgi:hypothetical protein
LEEATSGDGVTKDKNTNDKGYRIDELWPLRDYFDCVLWLINQTVMILVGAHSLWLELWIRTLLCAKMSTPLLWLCICLSRVVWDQCRWQHSYSETSAFIPLYSSYDDYWHLAGVSVFLNGHDILNRIFSCCDVQCRWCRRA